MRILKTTIESWPDVQYVTRQKKFRFLEIWNGRKELQELSSNEEFFSNDTLLGLTQEMKHSLFKYTASVFFNEEHNPTSLFALEKDDKNYYIFHIKKILDGQAKPCSICDINLKEHHLSNLNSLLLDLEKEIQEEKLIPLAGFLILTCDGVKGYIALDDEWINLNKDDIKQSLGLNQTLQDQASTYKLVNKIYQEITFEPTSEFPVEARVFVNYSGQDIVIHYAGEEWKLKSNKGNRYDCIVGAFHGNKCYMLFKNAGICYRSGKSLSIYYDHAENKMFLSIISNNEEVCIPDVLSFSCGEKDFLYITQNGEIENGNDLFNERLKVERKLVLMEEGEKVLCITMTNDNKVDKCLTSKQLFVL